MMPNKQYFLPPLHLHMWARTVVRDLLGSHLQEKVYYSVELCDHFADKISWLGLHISSKNVSLCPGAYFFSCFRYFSNYPWFAGWSDFLGSFLSWIQISLCNKVVPLVDDLYQEMDKTLQPWWYIGTCQWLSILYLFKQPFEAGLGKNCFMFTLVLFER